MSVWKTQQISHLRVFRVENRSSKIVILSLCGNKSKGRISSASVRFRCQRLASVQFGCQGFASVRFRCFWILPGLCGQGGCYEIRKLSHY